MILKQFPKKQSFLELVRTSNVIPLCTEILADMETRVSILQNFFPKFMVGSRLYFISR